MYALPTNESLAAEAEDDELLDIADSTTKLDVAYVTFYDWIQRGLIPYHQPCRNGKIWIRMSVVERIKELREKHGREWMNHCTLNDLRRAQ